MISCYVIDDKRKYFCVLDDNFFYSIFVQVGENWEFYEKGFYIIQQKGIFISCFCDFYRGTKEELLLIEMLQKVKLKKGN